MKNITVISKSEPAIKSIGKWSEVKALQAVAPELNWYEYEQILEGRTFSRWYAKNKKAVNAIAMATPSVVMTMFGVSPMFLMGTLLPPLAVPVAGGFFDGHGVILLHMLVVGFLTMVVSTFLKFTGRGDLIPLVAFVGGGVILYETMQLFQDIYAGIKTFFSM